MSTRGSGRIFKQKDSRFLACAYYVRGKEIRQSTGETDPAKARQFLKNKLNEVGADKIGARRFISPSQENVKVADLLDALEADCRLRGIFSPQVQSKLKFLREHFRGWRALEVTGASVDRFIAEMKDADYAVATINRHTGILRQAFKLAVKRGQLTAVPDIRNMSEAGNERQGFFGDAEFKAVESHLPKYLRDFARFAYLTGWRKAEIASLRWEDVDGNCVRLRGVNAKNGQGRQVILRGGLAELIERRKAAKQIERDNTIVLSAYIFHLDGEPVGDFRKAWWTACVAAHVGQFICEKCHQPVSGHRCERCSADVYYLGRLFHDLRRTAVRNAVRAGVQERVAMQMSGHKTRSIFDRYNIVNETDLRDAMDRVQAYLDGGPSKRPVLMRRRKGGEKTERITQNGTGAAQNLA